MRHRPLLAVAASLAGLLALAPAFAADSTSPQPAPGASASSTTATSAPGSGSSTPTSGPTTTTTAAGSSGSKAPGTSPGAPDDDADTGTDPSAGADDPAADDPAADDPAADDSANANCAAPDQSEVPAPEVGASESFEAGDAGTVELERISATDLHILTATPADGWDDKVATPQGPRVKGKFINMQNPEQAVRFAASLNSDGSMMRLKVTDCG